MTPEEVCPSMLMGVSTDKLTVRDQFAIAAMQFFRGEPEWIARNAYIVADAMLKERGRK